MRTCSGRFLFYVLTVWFRLLNLDSNWIKSLKKLWRRLGLKTAAWRERRECWRASYPLKAIVVMRQERKSEVSARLGIRRLRAHQELRGRGWRESGWWEEWGNTEGRLKIAEDAWGGEFSSLDNLGWSDAALEKPERFPKNFLKKIVCFWSRTEGEKPRNPQRKNKKIKIIWRISQRKPSSFCSILQLRGDFLLKTCRRFSNLQLPVPRRLTAHIYISKLLFSQKLIYGHFLHSCVHFHLREIWPCTFKIRYIYILF